MSEMIERVARALFAAEPDGWHGYYRFEEMPSGAVAEWHEKAREAITAMREPTGDMVANHPFKIVSVTEYQGWIDAALKSNTQSSDEYAAEIYGKRRG